MFLISPRASLFSPWYTYDGPLPLPHSLILRIYIEFISLSLSLSLSLKVKSFRYADYILHTDIEINTRRASLSITQCARTEIYFFLLLFNNDLYPS